MSLQTHRLQTLDQVRALVSSAGEASFRHTDRGSAYGFCRRTLGHFRYSSLGRREKGTVRACLATVTGLSRAQVQRLIRQYLETGRIVDRRGPPKNAFKARFTKADKGLLAEVDAVLEQRCGHATRAGDAADVRGVRRRALRASGLHLERPPVQPAQVEDLHAPPQGITIAALEEQAAAASDLDAALALNQARAKLFDLIQRDSDPLRRRSA